jgi:hypothetical protein
MSETQLSRLRELDARPLAKGAHDGPEDGCCIMEAVAYVAGEPWSDHPECACPVISTFLRSWNDSLPDGERDTLLRPLVIKLVGTRSTKKIEHSRSLMCADWLVRVQTPAWLRLAKLTEQADLLANLPEITSMAQVPSLRGPIEAVRKDAAAARDAAGARDAAAAWAAAGAAAWAAAGAAAWDAARDAAWDAAGAAAWAAARAAVGAAVGDAVGDAAGAAARDAAGAAAWAAAGAAARDAAWAAARAAAGAAARDAAWAAARAAARAAVGDALRPTTIELQRSALALVERMISCVSAS